MPSISKKKKSKISEQILSYLYSISPQAAFTSKIAEEIVRDEEFTKSLLEELEKGKLLIRINKGPEGQDYTRWNRWRLSNAAFDAYKKLH
ncbi:hypothetical protein FJZ21_03235 [Candidatus Pacearchaeota archaeon]|nr:hypothetical protein [Candidatus Pacearchaeota archaeon]